MCFFPAIAVAVPGCSLAPLAGLARQGHRVCSVTAEEIVHPGQHRQAHSPTSNRKVPPQVQTYSSNNVFCVPGIGLKVKDAIKGFPLSLLFLLFLNAETAIEKKSLRDREERNV